MEDNAWKVEDNKWPIPKAQWIKLETTVCGNHRVMPINYLVNTDGLVLARVRAALLGTNGKRCVRLYQKPVTLFKAADSDSECSKRFESDESVDNLMESVYVKMITGEPTKPAEIKKEGVTEIMIKKSKTPKNVTKAEGPYGTVRYKNTLTGRYVRMPA